MSPHTVSPSEAGHQDLLKSWDSVFVNSVTKPQAALHRCNGPIAENE
jgi:hypothetical protein